jgi:hypothetical protein
VKKPKKVRLSDEEEDNSESEIIKKKRNPAPK